MEHSKATLGAPQRVSKANPMGQLIGAIDQGTSSTRFLAFESGTGRLVASSQIEIKRIIPKEGWVEIDPEAIMQSVYKTIEAVDKQLMGQPLEHKPESSMRGLLKCIGICNQRESTVVWDSKTGKALYNVIVWMDNRTKDIVDKMLETAPGRDFNWLKDKTGLPMSTYFSAFKLKWLIDNVDSVKMALKEDRLLFGTVDSWILWNLTGKHLTDVTNASRTFLMDIETLKWDASLCKLFNVPIHILPSILSSADYFGSIQHGPLKGLPITGVIGDQSAALFGHNCLQPGQTKATFGTGCFIMQNIGPGPLNGALRGVKREAKRGLVTTVGYKIKDQPASYALEGSVQIAGAAITWLRDNMQLIQDYDECDQLVNKTANAAGLFFVPALGGLYSPYWDPNAVGLCIGFSQFSKREHLIRATFDSIAFQTNDILSLMRGVTSGLMIDGGLCKSENMCQILADITGCDIVRPSMCETSALGAAMVAATGADLWSYDDMLSSSSATYQSYLSSRNQKHHYPHESLHHQPDEEERFLELIHSGSPASQVSQARLCHNGRVFVSNLDADGERSNSGGLIKSNNGREEPLCGEDIHLGEENSEDEARNSPTSSSVFVQTVDLHHLNSNSAGGAPNLVTAHLKPNGNSINSDKTPSTGYCSGDNLDKLTSIHSATSSGPGSTDLGRAGLLESPIGDRLLSDQTMDRAISPIDSNADLNTNIQLSETILNQLPGTKFEDGDLYEHSYLSEGRSATSSDQEGGSSTVCDCLVQPMQAPVKLVDVYQPFISLEHRTELVATWHRAVERSMQWTKIQHEEIRKIDYLRLSSLPLSMYLFLSIGVIALSGLIRR